MAKFRLAVIAGSNRNASINRRLALALAKLGAASFEAHVVRIDDLPLYNQDLEGESWPQALRLIRSVSRGTSSTQCSHACLSGCVGRPFCR